MARKMEIERAVGLAEVLRMTALTSPQSRMVEPDSDTLEQVVKIGNAFIEREARQPENEGKTVYTAYQWPETGPAILALIWAVNVRRPEELKSGNPFFWRMFTETKEPTATLLSREDMEQELASYALQTFAKPTLA